MTTNSITICFRCGRRRRAVGLLLVVVGLVVLVVLQCDFEIPLPLLAVPPSPSPSNSSGHHNSVLEQQSNQKYLPSLKNGGIVFFLHIPKVGGTTIRELVKYQRGGRRSKVNYIYLTGPTEYESTVRNMKEWIVSGTSTLFHQQRNNHNNNNNNVTTREVVFIEYHALDRDCPTFVQMSQSILPNWKKQAKRNGIPFFAFAIMRDPISLSVSYHNFYHRIPQNPKRFDLVTTTTAPPPNSSSSAGDEETNNNNLLFLQKTIANPQCLFLNRNEDAYTKTGHDLRVTLTRRDCHVAYQGLLQIFDWVGTTDRIRNETLPLLKQLFQTNPYTQRLIRNLNKTANRASSGTTTTTSIIQLENLSNATIEKIKSMTIWDRELYERVKQDFSYSSWMI